MKNLSITLLLIVFSAGLVLAQPGQRRDSWRKARMERVVESLKLTPDQEKKFRQSHADLQKAMIAKRSAVDIAQVELKELMRADEPDKAAIVRKTKEINDLRYEQTVARLDHMFVVRKMLTPDQIAIWNEHHRRNGWETFGVGRRSHRFSPYHRCAFERETDDD